MRWGCHSSPVQPAPQHLHRRLIENLLLGARYFGFGGRRFLWRCGFVLSSEREKAAMVQLQRSAEEKYGGDRQKDQAGEKTVHGENVPAEEKPSNPAEGKQTQNDGNQQCR